MRFIDIRVAIYKPEFRKLFPELENEFKQQEDKFCTSCTNELVKFIIKTYPDRIEEYFKSLKAL